jgi:hypothetical protein
MSKCSICNTENPPEATNCQNCGFVLSQGQAAWSEFPTVEIPEPASIPEWPAWPEVETAPPIPEPARLDGDEDPVVTEEIAPAGTVTDAKPAEADVETVRVEKPPARHVPSPPQYRDLEKTVVPPPATARDIAAGALKAIGRAILGAILGVIEGFVWGFILFVASGAVLTSVSGSLALFAAIVGALAAQIDRDWRFLEMYGKALKSWNDIGFFLWLIAGTAIALPEGVWALGQWLAGRVRKVR